MVAAATTTTTTAAIFGAWWAYSGGVYRRSRRSFRFVGPVGPCRTCTRTGPRSTVTAFHLTSPCLSHGPRCLLRASPAAPFPLFIFLLFLLLLLLVSFSSRSLVLLLVAFIQSFAAPKSFSLFLSFSSLLTGHFLSLCPSHLSLSFLSMPCFQSPV